MTQVITLQAELTAAMDAVDIVKVGSDRMEAIGRETGQLLGTAVRSSHPQSDWVGWLVEVRPYGHEIVISPAVAELVLLYLASSGGAR